MSSSSAWRVYGYTGRKKRIFIRTEQFGQRKQAEDVKKILDPFYWTTIKKEKKDIFQKAEEKLLKGEKSRKWRRLGEATFPY